MQTWLASSHNYIKITTKIQNNHHSEPSEIELNGSLTTMELKKPHPSRLVGGAPIWNGLFPHPHVVDKTLGGISQEQAGPPPLQAPNLVHGSSARKIIPCNFWAQKQVGIELVKETAIAPSTSC